MPGENRLTLDVTLTERGDIRYTPAGITAIDCTLRHESMQAEAGSERRVDCELFAVAFGNVAERLAQVPIGSAFHCEGFLAPLSHRYERRAARHEFADSASLDTKGNNHAPSDGKK
ncbi:MAG: primosomal replication protein N [Betaproteobacteria bacterium]|nr:primosomal replication protein N [Betaproteobacteria bacterium]